MGVVKHGKIAIHALLIVVALQGRLALMELV
jgi:hypothetical protein